MDRHLTHDEMVLMHYGELAPDAEQQAIAHLDTCTACRRDLARLEQVLDLTAAHDVRDPAPGFEARVWQRLQPALEQTAPVRQAPTVGVQWRWMAAAAVLMVAAFVGGRYWPATSGPAAAIAAPADGVLLVDLGGHLGQVEMAFTDFIAAPEADLAAGSANTEDLILANRLYRATALATGDESVAQLLDDLERALIEIATTPTDVMAADLEDLRARIDAGLLFKVRILREVLQNRMPPPEVADSSL